MSDHTPGPWVVEGTAVLAESLASGPLVASTSYTPVTPAEREANARLIAAAPDLLAVARALVAYHTGEGLRERTGSAEGCSNCGGTPHRPGCHVSVADAAIAKAEGR